MKNDKYYDNLFKKILNETLENKADELMEKITNPTPPPTEFDYVGEGDVCECGGEMYEGECMECGKTYMSEESWKDEETESETDESREFIYAAKKAKELGKKSFKLDGEEFPVKESYITEKWKGDVEVEKTGQYGDMTIEELNSAIKKLKEKNEKTKNAGKKVSDADRTKMSQLYFAKRAKQGWKGKGKAKVNENDQVMYELEYLGETEIFTESEMIDMIEKIITEEDKFKKGQTPAGYLAYEKSHKGSGKEEETYMKDLTKKMKDYLKDGSKGEFEMNPKHFPKGNGQLEKMKSMKYTMSDDGKEFLDRYMRPGMEDLVPDEIEYDEEWVSDNIEGSTRTGNNPKWANAEETDLGKNINKKRKAKKYHKAKETAYRKSPQPITDGPGENSGSGLNIKESEIKKEKMLSEEFERMMKLMNYDGKTQ